jgi:hypothetical protein
METISISTMKAVGLILFQELVRRRLPELVGQLVNKSQMDFSPPPLRPGTLSTNKRALLADQYHDRLRELQDAVRQLELRCYSVDLLPWRHRRRFILSLAMKTTTRMGLQMTRWHLRMMDV